MTYTVYSAAESKVLFEIKNSYADEFGQEDDFGNLTYPEKEIDDVYFEVEDSYRIGDSWEIPYVVVAWETATPIDEEIIKEEDLAESYTFDTYYEFYTVSGQLIGTSASENVYNVSEDAYRAFLSFGKTIGVFDKNGKLLSTYNGDTEADPTCYYATTDKYDYIVVPDGMVDYTSESMSRTALEIYNKEGKLVYRYTNSDFYTFIEYFVLQGSDVIIQKAALTEGVDVDFSMGDMNFVIDTFLLDVETGKVSELADFGYMISDLVHVDDFEADEGMVFTENVRNIAYASPFDNQDKKAVLFIDNFGNVNLVSDYAINREMGDGDYIERVLDADHMLVKISSGVTDYAILDADGSLIAYVPDNATVLENYIVCNDTVYDLSMKRIDSMRVSPENWLDEGDELLDTYVFGDCIAFRYTECDTTYNDGEPEYTYIPTVRIYDVKSQNYIKYDNATISYSKCDGMGGYVAVCEQVDNGYALTIVNGRGYTVFTTPVRSSISDFYVINLDNAIIVEAGNRAYLITEAAVEAVEGDEYYEK